MHMADALVSPAVGAGLYAASAVTIGYSLVNIKKEDNKDILPVMGVMSAFVFAGQMVNFTIPGTGSSGHLCGALLLSALLGPQAAFLCMSVILTIQCLLFADGGLIALGANIWNMGFYGCFVGYYLIYRGILKSKIKNIKAKYIVASVVGAVVSLQLGAFSVCIETLLSGITELPFGTFLLFMQPIHLAIGVVEGLITAAVVMFVYNVRPQMLRDGSEGGKMPAKKVITILAVVTMFIAGGMSLLASSNPDGLEWSVGNIVAEEEAEDTEVIKTALFPDYAFADDEDNMVGTSVSGVVGSCVVALGAMVICLGGSLIKRKN